MDGRGEGEGEYRRMMLWREVNVAVCVCGGFVLVLCVVRFGLGEAGEREGQWVLAEPQKKAGLKDRAESWGRQLLDYRQSSIGNCSRWGPAGHERSLKQSKLNSGCRITSGAFKVDTFLFRNQSLLSMQYRNPGVRPGHTPCDFEGTRERHEHEEGTTDRYKYISEITKLRQLNSEERESDTDASLQSVGTCHTI
jgi:hypothetical protein